MPLTIKRTNTTSIAANSVLFNGSSQYLSIANNAAFNLTGDFTIECWFYYTSTPPASSGYDYLWGLGGNNINGLGLYIQGGVPKIWNGSSILSTSATILGTTWYHIVVVKNSSTLTVYLNGTSIGSVAFSSNLSGGGVSGFNIARWINAADGEQFPGYISNLRIVNGTALYTASFTPPTAPLTAIANTSLLTCNAPTIVDSSTNNFTITNNGSATVSSINPFRASTNNFQFARRTPTVFGKSVLFDGTNQYLSVGSVANWAFLNNGSTPFTIEAWINPTSVSTGATIVSTTGYQAQIGFYFEIGNYNNGDVLFAICDGRSKINQWATSNNFLTANTWTHVAVSFTPNGTNVPSATVKFFVNGILATSSNVVTNTTTYSTSNPTNTLLVGAYRTPFGGYFPGKMSNFRILNGTALYTASFTAPTAPLTAIANTALLTCNADTIADSSTNNFTITNNNGATVSSVSPFVASGGGMSLKKVYADPLFGTQKAIFGYGNNGATNYSITNLVSNTGVVANDTTGVGTARTGVAATGYGTDKAIFGYGYSGVSITNLVSNTGVVAADTTGVGTGRHYLAAAGYGSDKAIFGYGYATANVSMTNLVSNTGVVSTDTTGIGTARRGLAAAGYGSDKAIFGYGYATANVSMTNLVSNTGVAATDTTGVGTARYYPAAAGYGSDKAIFGYGYTTDTVSVTNLVNNSGVVATDTTGVGTARYVLAAAGYGSDKSIFGYGQTGVGLSMTNKVSNTGVVATDTTGVGTTRAGLAAVGYSLT